MKSGKAFVILWEFQVRPGFEPVFERVYSPKGDWAQLFSKAEGYFRTELNRDVKNRGRYLTMDVWESERAYLKFHETYANEYRAVDQRCEELTQKETALGTFETVTADFVTGTET